MTCVFWLINAAEKIYTVFNQPTYEQCVYGVDKYTTELNGEVNTYRMNNEVFEVGLFRKESRWCQVLGWFTKIGLAKPLVGQLIFFMLYSATIAEVILALIFTIVFVRSLLYKFPHKIFRGGCIITIFFFVLLLVVDVVIAGDRLEAFEHSVYATLFCLYYVISVISELGLSLTSSTIQTRLQ